MRSSAVVLCLCATVSACSSTSITMPTFGSEERSRSAVITESTARATAAYQQCALREADRLPTWNPGGSTEVQAATAAVDRCKARESQLHDVVLEDNRRASATPELVAAAYVKDVREKLLNSISMGFLQMRR